MREGRLRPDAAVALRVRFIAVPFGNFEPRSSPTSSPDLTSASLHVGTHDTIAKPAIATRILAGTTKAAERPKTAELLTLHGRLLGWCATQKSTRSWHGNRCWNEHAESVCAGRGGGGRVRGGGNRACTGCEEGGAEVHDGRDHEQGAQGEGVAADEGDGGKRGGGGPQAAAGVLRGAGDVRAAEGGCEEL